MPQALLSGNVVFSANEHCAVCHGKGLRPVLHEQRVGVDVCPCVAARFTTGGEEEDARTDQSSQG